MKATKIKVTNMTSSSGNTIVNQLIIETPDGDYFQSYDSVIARRQDGVVYLDANKWDYSNTTGKYRNIFLGETKKETEAKIKDGTYTLVDLNG